MKVKIIEKILLKVHLIHHFSPAKLKDFARLAISVGRISWVRKNAFTKKGVVRKMARTQKAIAMEICAKITEFFAQKASIA